jgi:thioredoxin reductase (NADPH)
LKIHLFEEVHEVKPQGTRHKVQAKYKAQNEKFEVITTKNKYTADYVIVATGFYDIPFVLDVPGEDLPKVSHFYKDPHYYAFQKVLIVGANNSAVDAALETWRKGADVTMVIRNDKIGERVKYWVKPDIENRIKESSIKVFFNSTVKEIRENEVDINTPDGVVTLENDWVLAMTGYQPNLAFLKKMGIELSNDAVMKPVYDETSYETNVKNVFIAGVICGGMNTHRLFIENSREHAEKIVKNIEQRTRNKE